VEESGGSLARYAGIGIQFAVAIVVFLFLGQWLDRKFGTSPVFLMLGVFVGGAAAFYSMYRKLIAGQEADEEARKREKEGLQ
jgi:F0F1-type ATP synthase assembly protein I